MSSAILVIVSLRILIVVSLVVLSLTCLFLSSFVFFFPFSKQMYLNSLKIFLCEPFDNDTNIWYTYSIVAIFKIVFLGIIIYDIYQKLMQYWCFCHRFNPFKPLYIIKLGRERKMTDMELDDEEITARSTLSKVPTSTVSCDTISLQQSQLEESSV